MIAAILQARMSSTRLPGKVMKKILGKPMILLQIERILRSKKLDNLVVATSTHESDDVIQTLCDKNNIDCYRGSLNDLLDRYYKAATKFKVESIVRLTADDPLTDPVLIDSMIEKFKSSKYDLLTNSVFPTYPEGLDLTILSYRLLEESWKLADLDYQREHVVPYALEKEDKYNIYHFKQEIDKSYLRWTVDYEEDLEFIRKIYKLLYKKNKKFLTQDVYKLIESNNSLRKINSNFIRNEGLINSKGKES
tara:strand:- start:27428 stop:28177 length:750 start_codon:yes stop_codon:yes gene_type:complete